MSLGDKGIYAGLHRGDRMLSDTPPERQSILSSVDRLTITLKQANDIRERAREIVDGLDPEPCMQSDHSGAAIGSGTGLVSLTHSKLDDLQEVLTSISLMISRIHRAVGT